MKKAVLAAKTHRLKTIVVGGGVSANSRLRQLMTATAKKEGLKSVFPSFSLCQDNAAMIAALGAASYRERKPDSLDLTAYAKFEQNPWK